jgi:hypothetical protein
MPSATGVVSVTRQFFPFKKNAIIISFRAFLQKPIFPSNSNRRRRVAAFFLAHRRRGGGRGLGMTKNPIPKIHSFENQPPPLFCPPPPSNPSVAVSRFSRPTGSIIRRVEGKGGRDTVEERMEGREGEASHQQNLSSPFRPPLRPPHPPLSGFLSS